MALQVAMVMPDNPLYKQSLLLNIILGKYRTLMLSELNMGYTAWKGNSPNPDITLLKMTQYRTIN